MRDIDKIQSIAADLLRETVGEPELPWYDSVWLRAYLRATNFLSDRHPAKRAMLAELVDPLRTKDDFCVEQLPGLLSADLLHALRAEVARTLSEPLSLYEREQFGREILHDRPIFIELQQELAERVGDLVGEEVVTSYNFLSLYGPSGVCEPHLDAPAAKWTLDICLDQSVEWPLYVSPVVRWPLDWDPENNDRWQAHIKDLNTFEGYTMQPGDGIIFSGSSQWHYRDPIPANSTDDFCHLLFLHYVPACAGSCANPDNWAGLLDVPALAAVTRGWDRDDQPPPP